MVAYFFICLMIISLPKSAISSLDTVTDSEQDADSVVQAFHQEGKFNGVILLAKKDSILYSGAFGNAIFEWEVPLSLDTRFRIASITKTFTASLTLKLIDQGKLSFDNVIHPGHSRHHRRHSQSRQQEQYCLMNHFRGTSCFQCFTGM